MLIRHLRAPVRRGKRTGSVLTRERTHTEEARTLCGAAVTADDWVISEARRESDETMRLWSVCDACISSFKGRA